jgi:phosphoenolpyruvate-protein phosphotransferase (PTS system enzyme I)
VTDEGRQPVNQILRGRSLSPGYGAGRAVLYPVTHAARLPRFGLERGEIEAEVRRLQAAFDCGRRDLERVRRHVEVNVGLLEAEIFAAHQAMLDDKLFQERIDQRVRRERVSAEQAVEAEVSETERQLAQLGDSLLRERAMDIRDVGRRLLSNLSPRERDAIAPLAPGSVVVAVELLPSETIDLDRAHVTAIVTEVGGTTSHVAILARALGIPAVTAVEAATRRIPVGAELLVDGETGELTLWPSESARRGFEVRARVRSRTIEAAEAAEARAAAGCQTRDGERIALRANLARTSEAHQVRLARLEGVGLFRTEFLFIDAHEPPSSDLQLDIYREVAAALGGLPLTIRTLDLGADKMPVFLVPHAERNPGIGLRGLRFSLKERSLFDAQLRAIARTAADADVRVLFPMVLGVADLRAARQRLEAAREETPGIPRVTVGAMIETPAAVFGIEQILEEADFVSIGTNDLTQFILAADRDAVDLLEDYSPLHPSVLRAIHQVVRAARSRGCPVSVCGEAAGDPAMAALLVGLGVRELSLSPSRATGVRQFIRRVACRDAEELAAAALAASDVAETKALLSGFVHRTETA